MPMILVNDTDNTQKLLLITESGSYFDSSRVIWDERNDGLFPDNLTPQIGGLVREGDTLVYDQRVMDVQIASLRQTAILQEWPAEKQLSAITDQMAGDSTAINQLLNFIAHIKNTIN